MPYVELIEFYVVSPYGRAPIVKIICNRRPKGTDLGTSNGIGTGFKIRGPNGGRVYIAPPPQPASYVP